MKNYFATLLTNLQTKLGSARFLQIRNNAMILVNEIIVSPFEMGNSFILFEGLQSSVFIIPNENCSEYEWLDTINSNIFGLLQSVLIIDHLL